MYTRTVSPDARVIAGNAKDGLPSALSMSVHPLRSVDADPELIISTYSSDSDRGTSPSKNTHAISILGPAVAGMRVGVSVGAAVLTCVGVGRGGEAVGVGPRDGVAVGV